MYACFYFRRSMTIAQSFDLICFGFSTVKLESSRELRKC